MELDKFGVQSALESWLRSESSRNIMALLKDQLADCSFKTAPKLSLLLRYQALGKLLVAEAHGHVGCSCSGQCK